MKISKIAEILYKVFYAPEQNSEVLLNEFKECKSKDNLISLLIQLGWEPDTAICEIECIEYAN